MEKSRQQTEQSVVLISLGCDKNRIDCERMASSLEKAGYRLCGGLEEADCAVINTCGFITPAKEEAISAIFDAIRAKQEGSLKAVVVTGCLAQRYCDDIKTEIPEVDAVVGLGLNGDIAQTVARVLTGGKRFENAEPEALSLEGERKLSTPKHYAYLKIAEGCRHRCTYCAIPMIRGKYRSRTPEAILEEARELAKGGVRELILIAQDVTAYGCDFKDGTDLASLLYRLSEIDGIKRIRILYGYPDGVTPRLIEAYKKLPKVARYLDIPLQHCCDGILKRMARIGRRRDIEEVLDSLRGIAPKFAVRTTFIAGFPGETEEQCDELCRFIEEQKFARSGCFAYSPEEGTAAERLPDQLEDDVKTARADAVNRACYNQTLDFQLGRVGGEELAICDGFDSEKGVYILRGEYDAPEIDTVILLESDATLIEGEFYKVTITGTDDVDLMARLSD